MGKSESSNVLPYTNGTFELSSTEIERARTWLKEHVKTCGYFSAKTALWFGSPIAYTFRPHGSGVEVEMKCNCGEKIDIADEIY